MFAEYCAAGLMGMLVIKILTLEEREERDGQSDCAYCQPGHFTLHCMQSHHADLDHTQTSVIENSEISQRRSLHSCRSEIDS